MSNFQKTLDSGETLHVMISYQDSDGKPNLYIAFNVVDAAGVPLKPDKWSSDTMALKELTERAFHNAGFFQSNVETMIGYGGTLTSMGMEHSKHKTSTALESAGAKVLTQMGFEIPMESVIVRPVKHTSRAALPETKQKPINFPALRQEFEDEIIKKYPGSNQADTKKAIELSVALISKVKVQLGITGMGSPGAGTGN